MDTVLQDVRDATRSLRRQPAFALLAIGTSRSASAPTPRF
jgi:hypothetical protein